MQGIYNQRKAYTWQVMVQVGSGTTPVGAPVGALWFDKTSKKLYVMIGIGEAGADARGWFNLKNAQYAA